MATGCRLVLKLDFSVDELMLVQQTWKNHEYGSLDEFARDLLMGKLKYTAAKPAEVRKLGQSD